jgi:hypothetical protein
MKYVGVADDIIFSATGEKVEAQHVNVSLEFGDLGAIELDLSNGTYDKIREMLKPIFAAVESGKEQAPELTARGMAIEMGGGTVYVTRETRYTNSRAYKTGCRVWAQKLGRLGEIKRGYFPVSLFDDFDAYLARNGG